MEELYNIGISEKTLKRMFELEPDITELSNEDIKEKIQILEKIDCTKNQIINIIGSNPQYLIRTNDEIFKLIKYLNEIDFKTLNILFEANPYILNLDSFEINNYINKRKEKGEMLEEILEDLDESPILFNEM